MRAVLIASLSILTLSLGACSATDGTELAVTQSLAVPESGTREHLDYLISQYAAEYEVPESLVHRVVRRESTYNPKARNGPNLGLMQIQYPTARTMGYDGDRSGLFDAETNLKYAVKYLRGAWLLADGSEDRAVNLYASGYYYVAKRRGMLVETGLKG